MKRRDLLLALGGAAAACAAPPPKPDPRLAEVRLLTQARGRRIAPDFIGLSYESSLLADPRFLSTANPSLMAMMARLAPRGLLRIGGNSSEFALWKGQPGALPAPYRSAVQPADIDRLGEFLDATGWRLIYGLNLGHGDPQRAADEAAYVAQRLGERLEALQIGNEPDLYERNGLRTNGYGPAQFIAEWKQYAGAIRAHAGDVPLAGPDIGYDPDWLSSFAGAAAGEVRFLSDHYYPVGPAKEPRVDIAELFKSDLPYQRYSRLQSAGNSVRGHGKPMRITEGNSCYSGGKPGLSDTFAAALWALGLQFRLAHDGWDGMCFHGGPQGPYTPIAQGADGVCSARPLYYGMLAFAQALGCTTIDTKIKSTNRGLRAFAAVDSGGACRLALVNLDSGNALDLSIAADRPLRGGSLTRLSAATLFSTDGVSFGGSYSRGGHWAATAPEPIPVQGGSAFVTVSAASAVILNLD